MKTARNAQDAMKQATRFERAKQLLTEGYTFYQPTPDDMVAVCKRGERQASYFIGEQLDGRVGCSCPDAAKGNECKHMLAHDMIREQEEAEDNEAMWAQRCKEYDETQGVFDVPSHRPTEGELLADLLATVRADIAKYEAWQEATRHEPFSLPGLMRTEANTTKLMHLRSTERILQN